MLSFRSAKQNTNNTSRNRKGLQNRSQHHDTEKEVNTEHLKNEEEEARKYEKER